MVLFTTDTRKALEPFNKNDETSVLPEFMKGRPEPMSDEAWDKYQGTMMKVINFIDRFIPNKILKQFS